MSTPTPLTLGEKAEADTTTSQDVDSSSDVAPNSKSGTAGWSNWLQSATALQQMQESAINMVASGSKGKWTNFLGGSSESSVEKEISAKTVPPTQVDREPVQQLGDPEKELDEILIAQSNNEDGWSTENLLVPEIVPRNDFVTPDPFEQPLNLLDTSLGGLITPGDRQPVISERCQLSFTDSDWVYEQQRPHTSGSDSITTTDSETLKASSTDSSQFNNNSSLSQTMSTDEIQPEAISIRISSGSKHENVDDSKEMKLIDLSDTNATAAAQEETHLQSEASLMIDDLMQKVTNAFESSNENFPDAENENESISLRKVSLPSTPPFDSSFVEIDQQMVQSQATLSTGGSSPSVEAKPSRAESPIDDCEKLETGTTASSDIEILSNITGNGDTMSERSFRSQASTSAHSPEKGQRLPSDAQLDAQLMHRRANSDQNRITEILCLGTTDVELLQRVSKVKLMSFSSRSIKKSQSRKSIKEGNQESQSRKAIDLYTKTVI